MSIKVSFRKDRNKWQVDYDADGKRHRPLFTEECDANNFARRLRLGLGLEDRDSITIQEAGKKYFESESQKKSSGSKSNDRLYINLLFHFMTYERGIERLASIDLEDMESFRDWLPKQTEFDDRPMGWKPVTVNRCIGMMKRFFKKHVQWKNIKESPCVYLDRLDAEQKSRPPMNGDQYLKVLKASPDWFKPVMQFMYLTGVPGSCISRLEWDHVDFQCRNYFVIRKKGGRVRKIPLPMTDEVFALFILVRNKYPDLDGPVFRDDCGRRLRADRISKVGTSARMAACVTGVVLYGLRHALASELTAANVATEIVRQAMGHASITTTQRYASKFPIRSIANAIETVRGASLVPNEEIERRLEGDGVNLETVKVNGG